MNAGIRRKRNLLLGIFCLQGMEYLHAKHIVHFDLKSGNLLLGYRDRRPVCKVADFGLSKQVPSFSL